MTFKSGMNRLDNLLLKRRQAFSSPRGESHAILLRGRGDSFIIYFLGTMLPFLYNKRKINF